MNTAIFRRTLDAHLGQVLTPERGAYIEWRCDVLRHPPTQCAVQAAAVQRTTSSAQRRHQRGAESAPQAVRFSLVGRPQRHHFRDIDCMPCWLHVSQHPWTKE